jgi:hypothetical protein
MLLLLPLIYGAQGESGTGTNAFATAGVKVFFEKRKMKEVYVHEWHYSTLTKYQILKCPEKLV